MIIATSSDSDDEQPAVGSRAYLITSVPSQDESRSSSTSDEAETVVDQFGWGIVNEDQYRSRYKSDPAFNYSS